VKLARLVAFALSLTATAVGAPGRTAQADGQGFTVEASGQCDLGRDFEARVAARLKGPVPGPTRGLVSSKAIEQGTLAVLRIERASGEESVRELRARDCEETVSALATVVAIALGALVESEAAPSSAPATLPPSSALAPPSSAPPTTTPKEPAPNTKRTPAAPAQPAAPWILGFGAETGLDFSLSPTFAYGGDVFGTARHGDLGPSVRLHAGRLADPSAAANGRGFEVSLLFVEAQGCPFAVALLDGWALEPCVALGVGRYTARGTTGLVRAVERSSLFTTPALLARSRVSFGWGFGWDISTHLSFPLQSRMSLIANGEGGDPIPLFDVPGVSAAVRTGFWLEFQ
jgi:hypothetical protein